MIEDNRMLKNCVKSGEKYPGKKIKCKGHEEEMTLVHSRDR